jgi:choline dehydrogenase
MINTPQILLLSGIGPKDELGALGINTLIDNQSVGKNFSDQSAFPFAYSTDLEDTAKYVFYPTHITPCRMAHVGLSFDITAALAQWNASHTGMLALSPHLPPVGWVRFPPDSKPFQDGSVDPSAGLNSPHVELFFLNVNAT